MNLSSIQFPCTGIYDSNGGREGITWNMNNEVFFDICAWEIVKIKSTYYF